MSSSEFEREWRMMRDYDLHIIDRVPTDLICIICTKPIIDARVHSCGCRYCRDCVHKYLSQGTDICPGKTIDCAEEKIDMNDNLWIDHAANRRILRLQVDCPMESCDYRGCLRDIVRHVANKSHSSNEDRFHGDGAGTEDDSRLRGLLADIQAAGERKALLGLEIDKLKRESIKKRVYSDGIEKEIAALEACFTNKLNQIAINQTATNLPQLQIELDKKQKELDELNLNLYILYNTNLTEFVWEISNFHDLKSNAVLSSNEFHANPNGCKMKLELKFDNSMYIVSPKLVSVDSHRDRLWPVRCIMTIGVISHLNQEFTKSERKTIEFKSMYATVDTFNFYTTDFRQPVAKDVVIVNTIKCLVKIIG